MIAKVLDNSRQVRSDVEEHTGRRAEAAATSALHASDSAKSAHTCTAVVSVRDRCPLGQHEESEGPDVESTCPVEPTV